MTEKIICSRHEKILKKLSRTRFNDHDFWGEKTVIVGASGIGKTTAAANIAGVVDASFKSSVVYKDDEGNHKPGIHPKFVKYHVDALKCYKKDMFIICTMQAEIIRELQSQKIPFVIVGQYGMDISEFREFIGVAPIVMLEPDMYLSDLLIHCIMNGIDLRSDEFISNNTVMSFYKGSWLRLFIGGDTLYKRSEV